MIHVDNALGHILGRDPYLNPYAGEIRMHLDRYNDRRWKLAGDGSICDFANGHHYFGFHRTETGWVFRDWLPGADAVWLKGDFNDWEPYDHPLTATKSTDGVEQRAFTRADAPSRTIAIATADGTTIQGILCQWNWE